jgi:hypothetical protein
MLYATASAVAAFAPLVVKPLHHVVTTAASTTALRALDPATTAVGAAKTATAAIAGMVLQGGATAAAGACDAASPIILQMDRVRIRLDGLASYGVICSLLMNAALRLYSATPKKLDTKLDPDHSKKQFYSFTGTDIIKMVFMVSTVISISAGSYTTVVFTLLGLYSKTALGLGRDGPFLEFFELTSSYRKLAFDAFVVSLVAFQTSFVTSLYLSYDKKLRWWSSGIASVAALFCFWQWWMIIKIASRLLFS